MIFHASRAKKQRKHCAASRAAAQGRSLRWGRGGHGLSLLRTALSRVLTMDWVLSVALMSLFGAAPVWADSVCYQRQLQCNQACGSDRLCQSQTCFVQAVACQRARQAGATEPVAPVAPTRATSPGAERQALSPASDGPRSYVLPPLNTCAELQWQGDILWRFQLVNNCPATVEVDLNFVDGAKSHLLCANYEICELVLPKAQVGEQFGHQLRYATGGQTGD